jgi:RNA polymerase sigma-70 factor (ECF subfamily)
MARWAIYLTLAFMGIPAKKSTETKRNPAGALDSQLVERLRTGDALAYRSLYLIYHKRLYAFAYSYFKSREVSEEIVHDVFVKIWEWRERLDEKYSFNSFIFTTARNIIIDTLRKYSSEQLYRQELQYRLDVLHNGTEDDLTFADYEAIARQAVEKLPRKRQVIFTLSRQHHLSYAEIAQSLGISQKTVENQMNKALRFIKDYLSKHADLTAALLFALLPF